MPDDERAEDHARERKHERTEHVENILNEVETDARERKYPDQSEELATDYADQPIDMPNETESIGSVFDRLDEEYDSPEEVREALHGELTGEAGGRGEYNEERPLESLEENEEADTR